MKFRNKSTQQLLLCLQNKCKWLKHAKCQPHKMVKHLSLGHPFLINFYKADDFLLLFQKNFVQETLNSLPMTCTLNELLIIHRLFCFNLPVIWGKCHYSSHFRPVFSIHVTEISNISGGFTPRLDPRGSQQPSKPQLAMLLRSVARSH